MNDVGICFLTDPPLIVPLSSRAKLRLGLPEYADSILYLDSSPAELLGKLEDDWMVVTLEDYEPSVIMVSKLRELH